LQLFLKSKVSVASDIGVVIENEDTKITLTNELYKEIKKIVCKQNFINNAEEATFNPANEKAKALLEKMKKAKEKIQKQNKEEGLS
jgi:vacuolar-type H+-ATPase subunit E/Vma4